MLLGEGALVGHAIDGLDLEGVGGVSPEVADEDAGVGEPQLAGHKVHVVVAAGAGAPVRAALLAHDVVGDIVPAARLPRRVPLQDDGRLVDDGDDVAGAGRDTCGKGEALRQLPAFPWIPQGSALSITSSLRRDLVSTALLSSGSDFPTTCTANKSSPDGDDNSHATNSLKSQKNLPAECTQIHP